MPTEDQNIDAATSTKQNFTGNENDGDLTTLVFKDKLRVWNKITRIRINGGEVAVIIPFNTLIEPFYSDDDIDLTIPLSGQYESSNQRIKLFTSLNGNFKILESKPFFFIRDFVVSSVTMTVQAVDVNGDNANSSIFLEINNGNEWIPAKSGVKIDLIEFVGTDLDADLPTNLYSSFSNVIVVDPGDEIFIFVNDEDFLFVNDEVFNYVDQISFQNIIKYRITRIDNKIIYINQVNITIE